LTPQTLRVYLWGEGVLAGRPREIAWLDLSAPLSQCQPLLRPVFMHRTYAAILCGLLRTVSP